MPTLAQNQTQNMMATGCPVRLPKHHWVSRKQIGQAFGLPCHSSRSRVLDLCALFIALMWSKRTAALWFLQRFCLHCERPLDTVHCIATSCISPYVMQPVSIRLRWCKRQPQLTPKAKRSVLDNVMLPSFVVFAKHGLLNNVLPAVRIEICSILRHL